MREPDGYVLVSGGRCSCRYMYSTREGAQADARPGERLEPVYMGEPPSRLDVAGEVLAAANIARYGVKRRLCAELGLPFEIAERDDFEVAVGGHFKAKIAESYSEGAERWAELPPGVEHAGWIAHDPEHDPKDELVYRSRVVAAEGAELRGEYANAVREVFVGPVEHARRRAEPADSPATAEARKWLEGRWQADGTGLKRPRPDGRHSYARPDETVMVEVRRLLAEEGEVE